MGTQWIELITLDASLEAVRQPTGDQLIISSDKARWCHIGRQGETGNNRNPTTIIINEKMFKTTAKIDN